MPRIDSMDTKHPGERRTLGTVGVDPLGRRGFITHRDTSHTSEGWGSHARGNIFPFVQIALANNLIPIYDSASTADTLGRDYSQLDVPSFLGFDCRYTESELCEQCTVLEVSTWSDPRGHACGDVSQISDIVGELLSEYVGEKPVLIVLYGVIRFVDPTPSVHSWLQHRAEEWRQQLSPTDIRVAVHVRVPEEWCTALWKADNGFNNIMEALSAMHAADPRSLMGHINLYTEISFPAEAEIEFIEKNPNATVHRGTSDSLLNDMKALACADILIASCSHFSAFAGYMCSPDSLIILANKDNEYFHQHIELGCKVLTTDSNGFDELVIAKVSSIK